MKIPLPCGGGFLYPLFAGNPAKTTAEHFTTGQNHDIIMILIIHWEMKIDVYHC